MFKIKHSAQPVEYNVKEFRDRNADNIPDSVENSLKGDTD